MYEKVKAYVRQHHMLEKKDRVIVGVSGGADSICLLFVLLKLREEIGFSLMAVHVNHGLREAAGEDEAYVRRVCEEQGVPLRVFQERVDDYARDNGCTIEEAGREVRRQACYEALTEWKGTKIALAHHRDDNAETLLWNLCRGAALGGLGGIAPRNGVWIRPLLCVNRREVESYLQKRGISYCTDETNLEEHYTRNRIRNRVIPYLEESVNRQAAAHIADAAERLRAAGDYIQGEVCRWREHSTQRRENGVLLLEEEYKQIPEALKFYVIHEILCNLSGESRDIEAVHLRIVEELLEKQVGRGVDLPYGIRAERVYEGIKILPRMRCPLGEIPGRFRMRVFDRSESAGTFPEKVYTKWFDYDIIKNTVKMRHRESGDYLTIDRDGRTQKLSRYFINEKIPQEDRNRIWLAADGHHIMWVVGYRQNQAYQITDKTRRILEIEFCKGENDGRDSKGND